MKRRARIARKNCIIIPDRFQQYSEILGRNIQQYSKSVTLLHSRNIQNDYCRQIRYYSEIFQQDSVLAGIPPFSFDVGIIDMPLIVYVGLLLNYADDSNSLIAVSSARM
jgi:hypothetical protein